MRTLTRILASGSIASLAAGLMLAATAAAGRKSAAQPLNATSHWLHGDIAAARTGFDWSHTGLGAATHHAATIFWAGLFEALRRYSGRPDVRSVARDAAVAATAAAVVDYAFTPHRLTPGWELVLSKTSIALVYAAMAVAFGSSEYLLPARRADAPYRHSNS